MQNDDQLSAVDFKKKDKLEGSTEDKSIDAAIQENFEEDKQHGTQMVIDQYLKQVSGDKSKSGVENAKSTESSLMLDLGDKLALGLLKMGAGGGKAKSILSAAVEYWPKIQQPFAKDPIDDVIERDGRLGKRLSEISLP